MQPGTGLYVRNVAVVSRSVTRDEQRVVGESAPGYEGKVVVCSETTAQDIDQQLLGLSTRKTNSVFVKDVVGQRGIETYH